MSTTVPSALCGARRPGWEQGPAIGINRIPCILSAGHEGEHGNAFGQTWPATAPLANALLLLADRLRGHRPAAAMTEALRRAQALVIADRLHKGDAVDEAERELLALLPAVTGQTRGEYAALLRTAAEKVGR
ncbi:hypothetical protein [Streptomyces sp. SS]|uniref:hypothetical protein n=1 Tax=Streptomyces sp. SS TaxID=260742 RepID=UPI0002E08A8C|nr:hypothetical protein [Streptomyces sp. SS]